MNRKVMAIGAIVVVVVVIATAAVALNWGSDDSDTSNGPQYDLEYSYYLKQETDTDMACSWNGEWSIDYNLGDYMLFEIRIFFTNVGDTAYTFTHGDFGMVDPGSTHPDTLQWFNSHTNLEVQPGETAEMAVTARGYEFGGIALNPEVADRIHAVETEYVAPDPTIDVFKSEFEVGDYYIVAVTMLDRPMGYTEPVVYCYRVEIESVNEDGTYDTTGSAARYDQTFEEVVSEWMTGLSEETVQQYLDPDAKTFVYDSYLGPKECYSVTIREGIAGWVSNRTYYVGTEAVNGCYPVYSCHWTNGWTYEGLTDIDYVVLYSTLLEPYKG